MTNSLPLVLALALAGIACTRWQPAKLDPSAHSDSRPYPPQQGVIASLPSPQEEPPRIVLCHAAIPQIGPKGEDEPSYSNTNNALMPFWLGPSANITGLKEGDRILFDLETDWNTDKPVKITNIKLDEKGKADLNCP